VQSVTSGGAADKAGIRSGDIIVAVDGVPVASFDELRGLTSGYAPGDRVAVEVNREGRLLDMEVTLGSLR
jgi:S1-C subfamily serine protease